MPPLSTSSWFTKIAYVVIWRDTHPSWKTGFLKRNENCYKCCMLQIVTPNMINYLGRFSSCCFCNYFSRSFAFWHNLASLFPSLHANWLNVPFISSCQKRLRGGTLYFKMARRPSLLVSHPVEFRSCHLIAEFQSLYSIASADAE